MHQLLEQLQTAAQRQDWDQIARLDLALRDAVAGFSAETAAPAEMASMLDLLQTSKEVYTQVLFQCQRQRIELKKQGQQLRHGQKAAHSYLSSASMA